MDAQPLPSSRRPGVKIQEDFNLGRPFNDTDHHVAMFRVDSVLRSLTGRTRRLDIFNLHGVHQQRPIRCVNQQSHLVLTSLIDQRRQRLAPSWPVYFTEPCPEALNLVPT
jgi:hypothetical protein